MMIFVRQDEIRRRIGTQELTILVPSIVSKVVDTTCKFMLSYRSTLFGKSCVLIQRGGGTGPVKPQQPAEPLHSVWC
jgi:hypothetical protein